MRWKGVGSKVKQVEGGFGDTVVRRFGRERKKRGGFGGQTGY